MGKDGEKKNASKRELALEMTVKTMKGEIDNLKREVLLRIEISRVVTSYINPDELLPNLLKVLGKGFGATGGAIYFHEKGHDYITVKATYGFDPRYLAKYPKIHLGTHVTGKVAETGEGLIIKDSSKDDRSTEGVIKLLNYRSAMATPVISKGEVVGIITLIHKDPDYFNKNDLKLLEFMGRHLSLAIVNSFLNQEMAQDKRKMEDILERIDCGIFEAEVKKPIDINKGMDKAVETFLRTGRFTLLNLSFQRHVDGELKIGDNLSSGFEKKQLRRFLNTVFKYGKYEGQEKRPGKSGGLFDVSIVRIDRIGGIIGIKGIRRDVTPNAGMK